MKLLWSIVLFFRIRPLTWVCRTRSFYESWKVPRDSYPSNPDFCSKKETPRNIANSKTIIEVEVQLWNSFTSKSLWCKITVQLSIWSLEIFSQNAKTLTRYIFWLLWSYGLLLLHMHSVWSFCNMELMCSWLK